MLILVLQAGLLTALCAAVVLAVVHFPYPSPLIRAILPPRKRWPENQIRGWLETGGFHSGYLRYFYRDPKRAIPAGDTILAPADGLVTSADTLEGIRYIVIALSFWDMHTQYSPLSGTVRSVESLGDRHIDGEGRDFAFLREKFCPVQTRIVLRTASGDLAVRLITSIAARRLEAWVEPGERIERGQRLGRILLGSTVVLEVPEAYRCVVLMRSRVRAGETVLARPEVT